MSLPNGYTRLLYIQSDGTQYIDTGFTPNQDTRVVCDVAYNTPSESGSRYLLGARQSNGVLTYGINAYGGIYQTMYNDETTDMGSGIATRFTIDKNKNVTTINGTSYTQTYSSFSCPGSMFIFALNNNGAVYARSTATLYSSRIYDNGMLVRDFIPAKNTSGVVGLWDDVNSVFYTDAAGGSFADPTIPTGDHNTLIGGVACEIEGGAVLIGGIEYELKRGSVMMDGTNLEIVFASAEPVVITITGSPNQTYRYATINGDKKYSLGTYEYAEMPTISVYVKATGTGSSEAYTGVSLNGTQVKSGSGTYDLHTKDRNITIAFRSSYHSVEGITTNSATITTS